MKDFCTLIKMVGTLILEAIWIIITVPIGIIFRMALWCIVRFIIPAMSILVDEIMKMVEYPSIDMYETYENIKNFKICYEEFYRKISSKEIAQK